MSMKTLCCRCCSGEAAIVVGVHGVQISCQGALPGPKPHTGLCGTIRLCWFYKCDKEIVDLFFLLMNCSGFFFILYEMALKQWDFMELALYTFAAF